MRSDYWIRADFHSHTRYSRDAWTRPAELVERAQEAGINRIAVTDHGEIEGGIEAQALDPKRVIVGEEIRCACGTELIGLFLRERIPMRLPHEEVVERIRDQGGVIYAPHPFAYLRHPTVRADRVLDVADVVEVFNSRAFYPPWNRRARHAAVEQSLPMAAGSDAHFPWEIGRAYTEIPRFDTAAELLAALRNAHPVGVRTASPWIHAASLTLKTTRQILRPRWSRRERKAAPPRPAEDGASEAA